MSAKNDVRDYIADALGDGWSANDNVFAYPETAPASSIQKNSPACRAVFVAPIFSSEPIATMGCPIWREVYTITLRYEKRNASDAYDLMDALLKKIAFKTIPPFSHSEPLQSNPSNPLSFDLEFARWSFDLRLTGSTDPLTP